MKTITLQNLKSFKTKGTKTYVISNREYSIFQCEDESFGCNFFKDGELIDVSSGDMLLREVKEEIVLVANHYNK